MRKLLSSYEFDSTGNWIRKTVSRKRVTESGELRLEPLEVTYRTITHYADTGNTTSPAKE